MSKTSVLRILHSIPNDSHKEYLEKSFSWLFKRKGFQALLTKKISSYPSPVKSQVRTKSFAHRSTIATRFHLSINLPSTFLFSNNFIELSSLIRIISSNSSLS